MNGDVSAEELAFLIRVEFGAEQQFLEFGFGFSFRSGGVVCCHVVVCIFVVLIVFFIICFFGGSIRT